MKISTISTPPVIIRPVSNGNGGIVPPWLAHPPLSDDTPRILPVPGPTA